MRAALAWEIAATPTPAHAQGATKVAARDVGVTIGLKRDPKITAALLEGSVAFDYCNKRYPGQTVVNKDVAPMFNAVADNTHADVTVQDNPACVFYVNDPKYKDSLGPDTTASSAKARFTTEWKPLAQKYDLPVYKTGQL